MGRRADVVVGSDVNYGVHIRIWPYGEMWGRGRFFCVFRAGPISSPKIDWYQAQVKLVA